METGSVAQRAIALITETWVTKQASLRSDEIAKALEVDGSIISARLDPYVKDGTLLACKVERPGGGKAVNEYRISAGGKTPGFRQYKPKEATRKKTPPVPVPAAVTTATPTKPKPVTKCSAPVRKVQRKTARKPRKQVRQAERPAGSHLRTENAPLRTPCADAGAFRTAIASDGAMIFLGAAGGPFELTRPESRALIEFVRTLDGAKLAA